MRLIIKRIDELGESTITLGTCELCFWTTTVEEFELVFLWEDGTEVVIPNIFVDYDVYYDLHQIDNVLLFNEYMGSINIVKGDLTFDAVQWLIYLYHKKDDIAVSFDKEYTIEELVELAEDWYYED